MNENETLEKNLLFNTLRTKYSKLYDTASSECCLIIVPRNKYLKFINIDEKFINNHILKPSKLLKSHYTPYKKSTAIVDVEIENDYLIVQRVDEKEKHKIKIINEEDAYNENNKVYKIFLVDKPLIKFKINASLIKDESLSTIYFTIEECESYLSALSPVITKEIKLKINKFLKTYLILPDYLEDAALKLKDLIDWSKQKFSNAISKYDGEALESSLECYILNLAYDKIFPVIKKHFQNEDNELKEQLNRLGKENIHFTDIGSNNIFKTYQPSNKLLNYLSLISIKKSPIEKIYIFKKILDLINDELNEFLNLKFYSPFSKSKYEILTDDLVALVVYLIIQFNLNNLNNNFCLISELNYVQIFSFFMNINLSCYGYALTTFEVATTIIKDYHFEFKNDSIRSSLDNSLISSSSSSKLDNNLSSNDSIKSFKCNSKHKNGSINDKQFDQLKKSEIRKQINFSSIKFNQDLDEISKIIEETSFSFQQLKNTEND